MGMPAAKRGDRVLAFDTHQIVSGGATSLVPMHPFTGVIDGGLSPDVTIEGKAAATVDSTATNTPRHIPLGGTFAKEPSNQAKIVRGSGSVTINGKRAARNGDSAETCNDPKDLPVGTVVATSKVIVGD
jgi:uncharacterized Zn-binding protein involved in type VI secretion